MKMISHEPKAILTNVLTLIIFLTLFTKTYSQEYNPHFWAWPYKSKESQDVKVSDMALIKSQGWYGVGVAGATNNPGGKYFFPSPTLSVQNWASFEGDRITPILSAAHANDLKLMVNMEWVNPNFWPDGLKYWTPAILKGVVNDLKKIGIDRWFDECFNQWSDLGRAIAEQCQEVGLEYEAGCDGGHVFYTSMAQHQTPTTFPEYYIRTNPISLYYYTFVRDNSRLYSSISENNSLAFGYAKHWGKSTAAVYTIGNNWGTPPEYWPGLFRATCLIGSLQFRIDNYMVIGADSVKRSQLNIPELKAWIKGFVTKQDLYEKRPVLNVVAQLSAEKPGSFLWVLFMKSGDAITSGAFHAGYNVVCSEKPVPEADAYFIYTTGTYGNTTDLTPEITNLFKTNKTVFLQCGGTIPSDSALTNNWKTVLNRCGIDWRKSFKVSQSMPATGNYKGKTFNFTPIIGKDRQGKTGSDDYKAMSGTKMPQNAVKGTIYSQSEAMPLIVGRNKKYLITGSCLNWQMNYVLGDLLNGFGTSPASNVWGIAGNSASAFMAISGTTLELRIPNLPDGQKIHVVQYDTYFNKIYDDMVTYTAPYSCSMNQGDLITIDSDFNNIMH